MKIKAALLTIGLLLVAFPVFKAGAFAEFIGPGKLPVAMALDPVNMILFGIGLMFAGTRA
jgi:hypothetical protein